MICLEDFPQIKYSCLQSCNLSWRHDYFLEKRYDILYFYGEMCQQIVANDKGSIILPTVWYALLERWTGENPRSPQNTGYLPPTPVGCSEESRESRDRQQSYATSGDGASVRVGYANTSELVSDILELVAWFYNSFTSEARQDNLKTLVELFKNRFCSPVSSAAAEPTSWAAEGRVEC